jgi:hypothetical protein
VASGLNNPPKLLTRLFQKLHSQSELQAKSTSSPEDTRASSYSSNSNSSLTSGTAVSLDTSALLAQTQALGYASQCELVRADVVWRPMRVERGCLSCAGGNQQRIQFKTSQYASELNLGHLIHSADNFRGNYRFE